MLRLKYILPLLFLSVMAYGQTGTIANGESGLSSRTKINETIVKANEHAVAIPLKLAISDTAAMLVPYVHIGDTAAMLLPYVNIADTAAMLLPYATDVDVALKLAISDTASMLTPYVNIGDTAAMLLTYVNIGDTAAMLSPYVNIADTAAMLSPYAKDIEVALKLNISDTASMLSPYVNEADTAAMLLPYAKDTDVALKLNISDTASMLAPYVNISDTAAMLSPYTSFWDRTGTDLSPATAGDDILLPTSSEIIKFGDGSTYIQLPVDDVLHFYVGDITRWNLSTTNFNLSLPITPSPNRSVDNGGISNFFKDGYINRLYIGNTTAHIDTSGTDMELTDGSGSYTLTELSAGAIGDTITTAQIAPIHSDTVPVFVFGYGTGRATDTLDCWDGAEIGAWLTGPTDSTSFVKFSGVVTAGEGTPTVTVQFFYDANLNDGTPTAITAATAIVSTTSGTEITSFTNQTVPEDMWIWGEITTVSVGNKPVKLRITAHKYTRTGE